MQTGPFFYSTNGTDVHGPVHDQDLRLLVLDDRLGRGSFLCRVGERTWMPFDPDAFRPAVAPVRTTRIVPAQMFAKLWSTAEENARPSTPVVAGPPDRPVFSPASPVATGKPALPESGDARNSSGPVREDPGADSAPSARRRETAEGPPVLQTPPIDARPNGGGALPPLVLAKSARVAINLSAPADIQAKASGPLSPRKPPGSPPANPAPSLSLAAGGADPAKPVPVPSPVPRMDVPARPETTTDGLIEEPEEPGSGDWGAFAFAFGFIGVLAALGASLLAALLARSNTGSFDQPRWVFVLTLLALIGVPFLVALLLPARHRAVIRASGMALLALGTSLYLLSRPGVDPVQMAFAPTPTLQLTTSGGKAAPGPDPGSSPADRAVASVTTALQAKIKASLDAERACKFTLENVQGTDDLSSRNSDLQKLRAAQGDVVAYLQAYDQHCREALAAESIPTTAAGERVAAAHKAAHVEANIDVWSARMKLTTDNIARFDYLRRTWGHWQFRNGQVELDSNEQGAAYGQFIDAVKADIAQIRLAQAQARK